MDLTEPPGTAAPTATANRAKVRGAPLTQLRRLALVNETGIGAAWNALHPLRSLRALPVLLAAAGTTSTARPGHATGVAR